MPSIFLLLIVPAIASGCQSTQATVETPEPDPVVIIREALPEVDVQQLVPSPSPSIHTSLWWNEEIAQRDLDMVQQMGFRWIKQLFPWRDIETHEKGQYDWWRTDRIVEDAEERGLMLLVRLDHQPFWSQANGGWPPLENAPPADYEDFGDFCGAVADRYQGRIKAYQVWNEPNLSREWGDEPPDPAEYTDLLAVCYKAIKAADPEAIVISAGLAPTGSTLPIAIPDEEFVRGMYEAGAAEYFDMLGVNAPGYAAPPEVSPEEAANTPEYGGHRWNAFRHVEDIRRIMLEYDDGQKQIAILEMGWTLDPVNEAYSWFAVTEEQQAEYLYDAYWWARRHWQPWIGIMTTIYLSDPYWTPENEEYWWSIMLPDWPETKTRPAYDALSDLPDWGADFYGEQADN